MAPTTFESQPSAISPVLKSFLAYSKTFGAKWLRT
jgi:hypothetical protein